ncbi:MAG: Hpt domain-containing protein [Lachnospiraceae bacterium]|nr:Hpt domain-containing protein [Lachnospiraceae bacterium]MBO4560027.1 Hpt domain-containing protein [Lachnospiraceae bacterium]
MEDNKGMLVNYITENFNPAAAVKQLGADIRSAVNTIFGSAELISHEAVSDEVLERLDEIRRSATVVMHTTDAVFSLLKILHNDYEIVEEEYNFEEIVLAIRKVLEQGASKKNLETVIDIDPGIPFKMFGDADLIISMLTQLAEGAIAATEEGNVTFAASVAKDSDGRVMLQFDMIDSGRGLLQNNIASAIIEKDDANKIGVDFVAMGLYTTGYLAGRMGGKLMVKTRPGKGCMFTLTVSQGKVGAETIGDRYEIEASGRDREVPFLARNARILVVAKNLGRAGKIRKLLSAYGVMADITDSTKESCSLLQKIDYDLILADAKMLDREGRNTADMIRAAAEAEAKNGRPGIKVDVFGDKPGYADIEILLKNNLSEEDLTFFSEYDYEMEELKALEKMGLNVRSALSNFGGSAEEYMDVLLTTCRSSDTKALMLNHYLEQHDYKNYIVTMHGILGVAQVIGADALEAQARELETAAKQGNRQSLEEKTQAFSEEFDRLLTSIRSAIMTQEKEINKGLIDKEDLLLIIYELKGYLNDYRVNEAEMLFYSLASFMYSNERVMELIHRAEEQMLSYNYNELNATLDEIIACLFAEQ